MPYAVHPVSNPKLWLPPSTYLKTNTNQLNPHIMSFISRLKAAAQNQSAFVDIQKALYDNKNSKKHCKSAADKLIRNGVTTAEDGKQLPLWKI